MALVIEYRCDYKGCTAATPAYDDYDGVRLMPADEDAGWCSGLWFYMKDKRKQKAFYGAHHKEGGVYCPAHSPWAHDRRYQRGTRTPDTVLSKAIAAAYTPVIEGVLRDGARFLEVVKRDER